MKRYDQLTFTRFLAMLLVLFFHGAGGIYIAYIDKFPLSPILQSFAAAVSYLYVLSGFVMCIAYYRPREKFDILKYWTARFIRLYPLYILSFALVCYYYAEALGRIKPQKILANIFMLQAWWPPYAQSFNYASWSMTVEFFFYAVFPFLVFWAYRQPVRRVLWVSIAFWSVTQVINFALWTGYFPAWELFIVYNPIFHLSSFVLGAAGGIWFVEVAQHDEVNQKVNMAILFGSLVLIALYIVLGARFSRLPHDLQLMTGLLAPMFVLIISTLVLDKTWLSRVLNHRWLIVLGESSFALYILHVPVIWLYERILSSSGLQNPQQIRDITLLPLTIAVGLLASTYIDPPVRAWMKNVLKNLSMPLLLLDVVIIIASIFISFRYRFGSGREYLSYRQMGILTFWSAFFFRTILSYAFKTLNPASLYLPLAQLGRQLFVSVASGSIAVALIVFIGYRLGWFVNFPRAVFAADFFIVFLLSLLTRFVFRALHLYKPASAAA